MIEPYVNLIAEFPDSISAIRTMCNHDLEYLRNCVLTDRSIRDPNMSVDTSRYYEGAKTLVDLVEYTDPVFDIIKPRKLELRIDIGDAIEKSVYIAVDSEVLPKALRQYRIGTGAMVNILYRYNSPCDGNPYGTYTIDVTVSTGKEGKTISTTPFCVSSGQILKYSYNFPMPSHFADIMERTIVANLRELDRMPDDNGE